MLRIGLTGGIGSGKSTVAAMLVRAGAALIDTDAIARAVAAPGGVAIPALREAFGAAAIGADGGLDRPRMRELAFGDPAVRRQLEGILHPLIGLESERQAAAAAADARHVVFDVPLLVESGRWRARVDRILVVDATEETQVRRVVARSGWSPEAVRAVVAQQVDRAGRRAAADAVVFNDALPIGELEAQVGALWSGWTAALR